MAEQKRSTRRGVVEEVCRRSALVCVLEPDGPTVRRHGRGPGLLREHNVREEAWAASASDRGIGNGQAVLDLLLGARDVSAELTREGRDSSRALEDRIGRADDLARDRVNLPHDRHPLIGGGGRSHGHRALIPVHQPGLPHVATRQRLGVEELDRHAVRRAGSSRRRDEFRSRESRLRRWIKAIVERLSAQIKVLRDLPSDYLWPANADALKHHQVVVPR